MTRTVCTLALAFALAPVASVAQDDTERGLRPVDARAVQQASRWVLGAQRQEREIARSLDPEGVVQEVERLQRSVRQLRRAQPVPALSDAEAPSQAPSQGTAAGSSSKAAATARRAERRQQALDRATLLAERRAALTQRLGAVPSSRQRRVAREVAAKLEALEAELRSAMDAPAAERAARLEALEGRLEVRRVGRAASSTGLNAERPRQDPTPTLRVRGRRENTTATPIVPSNP